MRSASGAAPIVISPITAPILLPSRCTNYGKAPNGEQRFSAKASDQVPQDSTGDLLIPFLLLASP